MSDVLCPRSSEDVTCRCFGYIPRPYPHFQVREGTGEEDRRSRDILEDCHLNH